ncbi:MAG: hypothetical protein ACJA1L_002607 [Paracoccaceae bacterium]|jgi:hypothetical protein
MALSPGPHAASSAILTGAGPVAGLAILVTEDPILELASVMAPTSGLRIAFGAIIRAARAFAEPTDC